MQSPWTSHKIEILRTLWAKGFSASQIANEIEGTTRCAILGKARRLGLEGRPCPILNRIPQRPKIVDGERFAKLWVDPKITMAHMMEIFSCSNTTLYKTAKNLQCGARPAFIHGRPTLCHEIAQLVEKKRPRIKPCRCAAAGCDCLAVPKALVCYRHGCGEIYA